jgi:hypothetical protein
VFVETHFFNIKYVCGCLFGQHESSIFHHITVKGYVLSTFVIFVICHIV